MTMTHGRSGLGAKAAVLCGICWGGVWLGVAGEVAANSPSSPRAIPSLPQAVPSAVAAEGGPSKVATTGAFVAGVIVIARSEVVKQSKPVVDPSWSAVSRSVASMVEMAEGSSRDGLKLAMEAGREQRDELRRRVNASLEQVALEQRRTRLDAFQRVETLRSSLRDHLEVLQLPMREITETSRGRRGED